MVVITQKPALLSVVDKIMVLANGAVALFGVRDRVLSQLEGRKQTGQQAVARDTPQDGGTPTNRPDPTLPKTPPEMEGGKND